MHSTDVREEGVYIVMDAYERVECFFRSRECCGSSGNDSLSGCPSLTIEVLFDELFMCPILELIDLRLDFFSGVTLLPDDGSTEEMVLTLAHCVESVCFVVFVFCCGTQLK